MTSAATTPTSTMTATTTPMPAIAVLQGLWLSLEARSDTSFFTSWGWIGTWLASLPAHFRPKLLQINQTGALIGLGVLIDHTYLRHRLIPVTETHLNETGVSQYDTLTIEYNDILWDRSVPAEVRIEALTQLVKSCSKEEFHAAGVAPDSYWTQQPLPGIEVSCIAKECNGVDLHEVRARNDYLPLISANTRNKIRKAYKEILQYGELQLTVAQNPQEAQVAYEALVDLHQQTWVARGKPGAFSNPYMYDFHLQLIRNRLAFGEIQLISIHSREKLLGVLYNFVFRGRVYNYQSGIDYANGNERLKPGLIIHSLAIEFCAKAGFDYYDLMAGDSQYKRSLGTRSNNLHWLVFQKKKAKFALENTLRSVKQRFIKPALYSQKSMHAF